MSIPHTQALSLLHAERGDLLYRHLRRLLASASAAQLDAACLDVWRRTRRALTAAPAGPARQDSPAISAWLSLLREAYLVAATHLARHPVPPVLPLAPEAAAAGHAAWLAIEPPRPMDTPSPFDAPAASERWQQLGDAVVSAIAELPLPHRAAILMHHDLMLPVAEIATVLDESATTVRALLWTALLHLRCRVGAELSADAHA